MSLSEEAAALPRARETDGSPVFSEPWHAEVLALAYALTENGLFSARDWADSLGEALQNAGRNGEADGDETYYRSALRALERLIAERCREVGALLERRVEEWRAAYLKTPHGKPVELAAGVGEMRAGATSDT